MKDLNRFEEMVADLCKVTGKQEKRKIIESYPECSKLLGIVLDPFKRFNVSEKSILKFKHERVTEDYEPVTSVDELIELLGTLTKRILTGHDALAYCNVILMIYPQHRGILLKIFDKNLQAGIGAKEVNSVYEDLVPTFDVCLAQKTTDKKDPGLLDKWIAKINQEPEEWTMQRKLDGVRTVIICDNGEISAKSRNGLPFNSIDKVLHEIIEYLPKGARFAIDGEICHLEKDGSENFSKAVSEVKRKSVQMESPKFIMFDLIPLDDFYQKKSEIPYSERYAMLLSLFGRKPAKHFSPIKSFPYSTETFKIMMDTAEKEGWEGLMLRKNTKYEGKRTNNLLKVKRFIIEEFVVIGYNTDNILMNDPITKIPSLEKSFKSAIIKTEDGVEVDVGTGWTQQQRRTYFDDPSKIVGKLITVRYQESSTSSKREDGSKSLRIPSVLHVWGNGRDI